RLRAHDPLLDEAQAARLACVGTRQLSNGRYTFKHDALHLTPGPYGYNVELAARFWSQITCPTLIIDAADSLLRLGSAAEARRQSHLKNSRYEILAGAGHMMQRHQPAALSRLLSEFLSS